jgi:hypothetical protein
MRDQPDLQVRVGTLADLDEVMKLAVMASAENGFVDANPVKLLNEIYPALMLNRGMCGLIGQAGGIVEGVVLLRVGNMWYSDAETLDERAIFIHPDYRSAKGGRAARLCEFSKRAADHLGLPLVIGVLSNARTMAKVRLYQRQFGEPQGAFWIYGAKTGDVSKSDVLEN